MSTRSSGSGDRDPIGWDGISDDMSLMICGGVGRRHLRESVTVTKRDWVDEDVMPTCQDGTTVDNRKEEKP